MSRQDLEEVICEGGSSTMETESSAQSAPMLHPHSWQRIDLQSSVDDEIAKNTVDEGLEGAVNADLDGRRSRWRFILAIVSVVCITTIVCVLFLGNVFTAAREEEDNGANGPKMPESVMPVIKSRGPRSLNSQGKVFSVKGKNITASSSRMQSRLDKLQVKSKADIDILVADWEATLTGLDDGLHAAAVSSSGKIVIRTSGVYYVYSNFAFYAAGTRCSYELQWGKGVAERQTCFVDMGPTTMTTTPTPHPIYNLRKCSLGFLVKLESGVELEPVYKHKDSCRTEQASFLKALPHSEIGLFKVD